VRICCDCDSMERRTIRGRELEDGGAKEKIRFMKQAQNKVIVYQKKSGAIAFRGDDTKETLWASLQQIADLFDVNKSGISRHIKNILETQELEEKRTVAIFATVQKEGKRTVERNIEHYNLDMMLSVGYRVNSKKATAFRQWATTVLREHLTQGYTINRQQIAKNYEAFLQSIEDVKKLLPKEEAIDARDVLDLVQMFSLTWLSLDAYDRSDLPKKGVTKKRIRITADELAQALAKLKNELIKKGEATQLFGQERTRDAIEGIVGNVFQSFGKQDLYPTIEEKAANLLYFMVKDHPFSDGNKRSGAFAFVWFLQKAKLLDSRITPETLATITLLIAESDSKEKDRMIGLLLVILGGKK